MPEPVDQKMYNRIKKQVKKDIPKHSAYRSGIIVQKYKKAFTKKYGSKSPYKGKKTSARGLGRWFREKWRTQNGKIGYHSKSDIYRPTIRITKGTPVTHSELTKKEKRRARRTKRKKGYVYRFRKKTKRKQKGGSKKVERIVKFMKGPGDKKYTVRVMNKKTRKIRHIHFGAKGYEQFKDSTPLGLYSSKNHGTKKRKDAYYSRHSGTKLKAKAIKKEFRKSGGKYTPKLLSHIYLW
tara:strand:- start:191 stop:901 length:711 start_codon:yes stop_codon:yes gene_type:complete